jgi:hypothetical protein
MALSEDTIQQLRESLAAIEEFYERRLAEIDRDVRNLREYGAPISDLGDTTTESAADLALDFISGILS